MAKMWNKWTRSGTEMGSSTSRMIEKLAGSGRGSKGKIKFKPLGKSSQNISGETQSSFEGGSTKASEGVLSDKQRISFLLKHNLNKLLSLFAVGGATKALNKRKEDKKKRVSRTILTEY